MSWKAIFLERLAAEQQRAEENKVDGKPSAESTAHSDGIYVSGNPETGASMWNCILGAGLLVCLGLFSVSMTNVFLVLLGIVSTSFLSFTAAVWIAFIGFLLCLIGGVGLCFASLFK